MARRSVARRRPAGDTTPQMDDIHSNNAAGTPSEWTRLLEITMQEILAVTYWFDPVPQPEPYPVTVRFSGRRIDVKGRLSSRDRFDHEETIEKVVPGSGPISLTAHVRAINAGSWVVTARMLESTHPARGPREQGNAAPTAGLLRPAARFWRRWAPAVGRWAAYSIALGSVVIRSTCGRA